MGVKAVESSIGVLNPTVTIKNGPCVGCHFWIEKRCRIEKQPNDRLECGFFCLEDD